MKSRATKIVCFAVSIGWCFLGSEVKAQVQPLPTTVQLPSFSSFSYSGSVLVPVNGATSLGGVSRSQLHRRRNGLNRSASSSLGHSGASVRVTVIDHNQIDRQLRGLDKPVPGAKPASQPKPKRPSSIDIDAEGKMLVRYARQQYRAGNLSSSFNAYQMSFSALSPKLRTLAEAEFRRVFPRGVPPVRQRLAKRAP